MTTYPEALRLAEVSPYLEGGERGRWIIEAAAELRRLHAENEAIHQAITDPENQPSQFGTVTLTMYEALEAQRDALLEALKKIAAIGNKMWGTDWEEIEEARGVARAAIKAVEGENHAKNL